MMRLCAELEEVVRRWRRLCGGGGGRAEVEEVVLNVLGGAGGDALCAILLAVGV